MRVVEWKSAWGCCELGLAQELGELVVPGLVAEIWMGIKGCTRQMGVEGHVVELGRGKEKVT